MDVQTISIATGLMVSLAFSEVFGLAAGGMIVPGYFALAMGRPGCILMTLLAALLTFALVKLVSQWTLLYGRRRIALMLICGFAVGAALRSLLLWAQAPYLDLESGEPLLSVVGFIIPGLIALWIDRQGLVETMAPLLTLSVAVRLVLIVIGMEMLS